MRGHVAKLRFAHPGGDNPPTFIVHGTRLRTLPDSYRRYLENFFRKRFKLVGTPVRFIFKEGDESVRRQEERADRAAGREEAAPDPPRQARQVTRGRASRRLLRA